MIAIVHSIYLQSVHALALNAGLMDNDAERYCSTKTSQNKIVLTCYFNTVKNVNTSIGHNIVFLKNTLRIDIDTNEITPDINLPKVYFTNEQRVLLTNLKLLIILIALERNILLHFILPSYEIKCLITNIATL